MVQDWSGDFARQGRYAYQSHRYGPSRDDGRHEGPDSYRRHPPMQIAEALRRHCGIDAEQYFLAVRRYDSSVATFFSPSQLKHDELEGTFFDEEAFRQVTAQPEADVHINPETSFDADESFYRRPMSELSTRPSERRRVAPRGGDGRDGASESTRKRHRARHHAREEDYEETMSVTPMRGLKIGDTPAVYAFYDTCFKGCQQYACKLMAKAWIKLVEPKKQSVHPYTGKEEKQPGWWPRAWGSTKDERVRHKEPDHLYKTERIHLLIHILRLVIEPVQRQHPDIQKLNLNVKKLEETTWEALSSWFAEGAANAEKKPPIQDLFRIAKLEERYKDGNLDGTTTVYVKVVKDTKGPVSETDDARTDHEDEDILSPARSAKSSTLIHSDRSPGPAAPGALGGDLPMRAAPFAGQHGQMMDYMPAHQAHSFNDTSLPPHSQAAVNPPLPVEMVQGAANTNRRGSLFQDLHTHGQPSVFSGQWQSVAPTASNPGYSYPGPQTHSEHPAYANAAPVPMAHSEPQGYLHGSFDGLPRPSYDPNAMFRQQGIPTGAGNQPHPYQYSSPDETGLREAS